MSKSLRTLALLGLVVLLGAACTDDRKAAPGTSGNALPTTTSSSSSSESESSAAGEALSVIAVQPSKGVYAFDTKGVEELLAGEVDFSFTNSDAVDHEARVIRVLDGNVSAYRSALDSGGADAVKTLGQEIATAGPNDPGKTSSQTITLEPGTYVVVDFLTSSDGTTYAAQGLVREFRVVAG